MNASILTSDRYIAILNNNSVAFNKTVRILCRKDGQELIVPCKWNDKTERLESVAIGLEGFAPAMYHASKKLEAKLFKAGHSYQFLTEANAKALTT